jgi:hypothetical protein
MKAQWVVEFHPEFASEFIGFSEPVRQKIIAMAGLLTRISHRRRDNPKFRVLWGL